MKSIDRLPGKFCRNGKICASALLLAALLAISATDSARAEDCLATSAGDPDLECTANDLGIASVTISDVSDGCAGEGDTFTFDGTLNVSPKTTTRYDLGFYIGPGGQALFGTDCTVTIIPPVGAADIDGDACGDNPANSNLAVAVTDVTALCTDIDGDSFFDITVCASYDNNSNTVCNGEEDAIPGTGSKCQCSQVPTDLQVPHCETNADCPSDGNVCTDEICNSRESGLGDFFGCSSNNNTAPCDDGIFCNGDDVCVGGSCGHSGDPCAGGGVCGDVCNEVDENCFVAGGTVCREAAGVCDEAEECTGSSASCPADDFLTVQCRAAAGVCDQAESCTGASADCPADTFTTALCRASAGVCDVPESCSGSSAACPNDGFALASVVCRGSAGECDVAENCTGASAGCPADASAPDTTPCATDDNVCTDDFCDGNGQCAHTDNTAPCNDGAFCTAGDVCSGGICGGAALDCSDGIECTLESCNESTNECEAVANDIACDDGDVCTEDSCQELGCVHENICGDAICRSPGFWAEHSGGEAGKNTTVNVGQELLDAVGPLDVCGQTLSTTSNASSPYLSGLGLTSILEALCVRVQGEELRALYRQLVAAALNCAITGGDCDTIVGDFIDVTFSECNTLCETETQAVDGPTIEECIDQLDCFNNGGQIEAGQCAFGTCIETGELCNGDFGECPLFNDLPQECEAFPDNCHDAALCNDDIGVCPDPSAASSVKACQEARGNTCTIDSCD